jgi:hypothetical protein
MTHTYATLDVPRAVFAFVKRALLAAGYEHAVSDGLIDMHGIALTPMPGAPDELPQCESTSPRMRRVCGILGYCPQIVFACGECGTATQARLALSRSEEATPAGLRARALIMSKKGDESCARHLDLAAEKIETLEDNLREAYGKERTHGA